MKKQIVLSLIAGCAMALTSVPVFADAAPAPAKAMPMSTILQNLEADGYVAVKKIKFEDGFYKAEAINAQGKKVEVELSSETGKVIKPKETKRTMSMLAAVKKVEEAGYHGIGKVESEENDYEIKALDKDGKKTSLKIDVSSGDINKKLFD